MTRSLALALALAPRCLAAATALAVATSAAAAPLYHFTDLGDHLAYAINASGDIVGSGPQGAWRYHQGKFTTLASLGGPNSIAFAINRGGVAAGMSPPGVEWDHAVIWPAATPVDLAAAQDPDLQTEAHGISDAGIVVGSSARQGVTGQAFAVHGGTWTWLGLPAGAFNSALAGINNHGQAVGYADVPFPSGNNYAARAVMFSQGQWRFLGTISRSKNAESYAQAINDKGQVTGVSNVATPFGVSHAFLWANGHMRDLGALGDPAVNGSGGLAINASGHVVGHSEVAGASRAFVHDGTAMADLNTLVDSVTPGHVLSAAWGINDAGAIVGVTRDGNGASHGFLLTPLGMAAP